MSGIHHSFDIDLATIYGPNEAVLIHHFQYWIRHNRKLKRNLHKGRTWSYQTLEEIAAHYPYLSTQEVRGLLERLTTGKGRRSRKNEKEFVPVLLKGNFNRTGFDRTTWYAFADEGRFLDSNNVYERETSQMEKGDLPNPKRRPPTPIPDTKPDAKETTTTRDPQNNDELLAEVLKFVVVPSDIEKVKKWIASGKPWQADNPVGYIRYALQQKFDILKKPSSSSNERKTYAQQIKDRYEDKLPCAVQMFVNDTHFLILSGHSTYAIQYRLSMEDFKAQIQSHLKRMNLIEK